jgi:hypothetical protein
MKRIVLTCGLISGVIVSVFMVASMAWCYSKGNFDGSMLVGYAAMLLCFSLIFVGVKNYRDKYNQGFVTFGKAFQIGLGITLIASTMYVIVWMIEYHYFIPDFIDRFSEAAIRKERAAGATKEELSKLIENMDTYREMYKNPFVIILWTYIEILPVGLVVSLLTALLLRRSPGRAGIA